MRHRALALFTATGLAAVVLAGCGSSEEAGGSVEEFCGMESRFDDLDGIDPTTDEGLAQAAEVLEELEAVAPGEIKDDVATVRQIFVDTSGLSATQMMEMDADEVNQMVADLEASGANVEAFIADNCG